MYNSLISASRDEQSDNLPGRLDISRAPFLRVKSRAFLAAARAREAIRSFSTIILPTDGFSNKNLEKVLLKMESVTVLTSLLPSFVFVWPSNWGSGCLMDTIAVNPSLTSSPVRFESFSLNKLLFLAYSLITRVKAVLNPTPSVPPSRVLILFAKEYKLLANRSLY